MEKQNKNSLLTSSRDQQITHIKQKQKDIKKKIDGTISTKKISNTRRSKISTGVFQDKIEEIFPGNTTKSGRKREKNGREKRMRRKISQEIIQENSHERSYNKQDTQPSQHHPRIKMDPDQGTSS